MADHTPLTPSHTPGFNNLGLRIFQADSSQIDDDTFDPDLQVSFGITGEEEDTGRSIVEILKKLWTRIYDSCLETKYFVKFEDDIKESSWIEYLKGEQKVESKCCHSCLDPVSKNFSALLMFLLPNEKSKALEEMEKVRKRFPKNLNTLANLAYMYNERKVVDKENECRERIKAVMKADTNKMEIAKSLAEQGYIMMIDLHSETREGPEKTLNLFADQIQEHLSFSRPAMEIANCESILKYVSVIRKKLHGLQTNCHRETTQEKLQAMKKLRDAIEILEKLSEYDPDDKPLTKEVAVWKHYLGKAYIRISGGSSEIASKIDKKMYIQKAVKSLVSALQLETDTADENELRIVARTYAYIAFVCIQKSYLIKDDHYFNSLEIKGIKVSENPLLISKLAEKLNNTRELNDRVVLNKIGVIHTLKEEFDTAEQFFKKSIEVVPDYNWFAYSYLCNLYLNKHVQRVKREKKKTPGVTIEVTSDLNKAKEYGTKCLEMRKTSVTLFRVAKACKYMKEWNEAIEYLQTALRSHECEKHPQIYAQLANCWYEKGEFKSAVHMMKIAITIEPKNLRDPLHFRDFLNYLLEGFRKEVRLHRGQPWKQKSAKLQEICCVLEEGYRKHKMRIRYQLIGIINLYPHEFIVVLKELLIQYPTERRAKLVDMCAKAFKKRKGKDVERRVEEMQEDIGRFVSKGSMKKSEATEDLEMIRIRQISKETEALRPLPDDFQFDFYVLVSSSERAWVENIFLDVIEKDYSMTETILRGRIYHPDDNTRDIMKTCKMFVFVISEDFTTNPRIERIAQEINERCIDQKENRIIPITREVENIPDFLKILDHCEADNIFKIRNAICGLTYSPVDMEDNELDDNDTDDTANNDIDDDTDDVALLDASEIDQEDHAI